jgi:hypothetical protein
MTTSSVSVGATAFVSLGTGPMIISPEDRIAIVAAGSQPVVTTVGHPIEFTSLPFYFPLAEQVWAIALGDATTVIVTV